MPLTDEQIAELEHAAEEFETTKQAHKEAKAAREATIRRIAATGASYRDLARHSGLSYQRVGQLLTGENPPMLPGGGSEVVWCPRCEAEPQHPCWDEKNGKRKERFASQHIQRHNRFVDLLLNGTVEPRPDEPAGPMANLYTVMKGLSMGGNSNWRVYQSRSPLFIDPEQARAWRDENMSDDDPTYIGVWDGHDWQPADGETKPETPGFPGPRLI